MRLYSFVAGNYLSNLQKGIQTAHGVSELFSVYHGDSEQKNKLDCWAKNAKTIIVLNAFNHQGVLDVYDKLEGLARKLELPITIFNEDGVSMNNMATCTAIVVPTHLYDVKKKFKPVYSAINPPEAPEYVYVHEDENGTPINTYEGGTIEYEFIEILKSYPLA